jgi:hypothetical protein
MTAYVPLRLARVKQGVPAFAPETPRRVKKTIAVETNKLFLLSIVLSPWGHLNIRIFRDARHAPNTVTVLKKVNVPTFMLSSDD